MKKFAASLLRAVLAFLIAMLIFSALSSFAITVIYPALTEAFPGAFPEYNPIFEKEELLKLNQKISFYTALISTFILSAIDVRHDNSRLEFLISKTDGFYTIGDGIGIYARQFFFADVISSLSAPVLFLALTLIKIPENTIQTVQIAARFADFLDNFLLAMPGVAVAEVGMGASYILFVLAIFLGRTVGAYSGLFRWRALWLSDVGGE